VQISEKYTAKVNVSPGLWLLQYSQKSYKQSHYKKSLETSL